MDSFIPRNAFNHCAETAALVDSKQNSVVYFHFVLKSCGI